MSEFMCASMVLDAGAFITMSMLSRWKVFCEITMPVIGGPAGASLEIEIPVGTVVPGSPSGPLSEIVLPMIWWLLLV